MKWTVMLLTTVLVWSMTLPAQAQIFFNRKPRLTNVQPTELLVTARTDPDERRRAAAIEQLRELDPKTHPEIVPTLVDILLGDGKYSVRLEAVNSLSRIRPISQMAGQALETAAHRDDSIRVRIQAKTSLWSYQHAGYRPGGKDQLPPTKEPPLAGGTRVITESPPNNVPPTTNIPPTAIVPPTSTMPLPGTTTLGPVATPAAPPQSPGVTARLPQGNPVSIPRPLPSYNTATPTQPRRPLPPPPADGPILVPVDR